MRLVEEENQLRLVDIADFRQFLEQLRQQPEQERRIELGIFHQLVRRQDIDDAAPLAVGAHEVVEVERGLAEEGIGALVLQHQKLPLDGADGRGRYIAVDFLQLGRVVSHQAQNRAQILQIEQRKSLLVGETKGDIEHAFLDVVELQHPRQQQRSHFGDGCADRMTLLAKDIPEDDGKLIGLVGQAHRLWLAAPALPWPRPRR